MQVCVTPFNTFIDAAVYLAEFRGINAFSSESSNLTQMANLKISILNRIGSGYQLIIPFLIIPAIVTYILTTIDIFRKYSITDLYIINSLIIIANAGRIFILSWMDTSSFPAVNTMCLSPAYPLLPIFINY